MGPVQWMASSLLSKIPNLQGKDMPDAKFVHQMVSLWPNLADEDKHFIFKRLNLFVIVAALGKPTAIAACNASTNAATDFNLLPCVVLTQPSQRQARGQRQPPLQQQQQQPQQAQYQVQQKQQPGRGRRGGRR